MLSGSRQVTGVIGHTQDLVTTNSKKQQKCKALKKNYFKPLCLLLFNSEELILCERTQLTGEFMVLFFAFACDDFRSSSD